MAHVKDTYTFLHDANARNDEKLLLLRAEYGLEGYGWYWSVIEMLREANAYQLQTNCSAGFALALGITGERFTELLQRAVAVGLFTQNETHFWSPSLLRRMAHYDNKRARLRANALQKQTNCKPIAKQKRSKSSANEVRLGSDQSKRKEGEPEGGEMPKIPPSLDNADGRQALQKWHSYKRGRGESYKSSQGWTSLFNTFGPLGAKALAAAVDESIRNSWAGIFPPKVNSSAPVMRAEPSMTNHPARKVVKAGDPL